VIPFNARNSIVYNHTGTVDSAFKNEEEKEILFSSDQNEGNRLSYSECRKETISIVLRVILFFLVLTTLVILFFKQILNKRTEEIRNREYKYRTLVEQAKGIILSLSAEGTVLLINESGLNLLGSKEDEVLHKNIMELDLLPDDLSLENLRDPENLNHFNLIKSIGNGEKKRVLQWSLNAIREQDGRVKEILCLGVDITDRIAVENALKESEKKFISFMNNIPAYAFITNIVGEHIYLNPATLSLLETNSKRFKSEDFFSKPEILMMFNESKRKIFSGLSQSESLEFEGRTNSSEHVRLFQLKLFPIFLEDRNTLLGGIAFDVTESREIEEQLNHSRKMQAIGVLAGGVAHDFNNQLSSIMGYAGLLTNKISDPLLTKYADKLMVSIDRASQTTQQLLSFSRKEKKENGTVLINDLIDELIDFLTHSIDKGITIEFNRKTEKSQIQGDKNLIQNALLNISLNARDAMNGEGRLFFSTRWVMVDKRMAALQGYTIDPGNYLVVYVEDTGPGIPKGSRDKIFEPFFTTKPKGKGTGMGLAMVYSTMKEHHGNITVQSTAGKGTVFKLYFPGRTMQAQNDSIHEIRVNEKARQTLRIAVVDDEIMIRDFLEISLEEAGHTTTLFSGGKEFITALEKDPQTFDLVILDMMMPGLSGLQTYQSISRIRPGLPVLLSSGYSPKDDIKEIIINPRVKYLQKPYSLINLLKTILELTEGPSAHNLS